MPIMGRLSLYDTSIATVLHSVYHTPLAGFSVVDISAELEVLSVPKRSALESCRRELSEDVSFGIGTLLVVEQSTLENRPTWV